MVQDAKQRDWLTGQDSVAHCRTGPSWMISQPTGVFSLLARRAGFAATRTQKRAAVAMRNFMVLGMGRKCEKVVLFGDDGGVLLLRDDGGIMTMGRSERVVILF